LLKIQSKIILKPGSPASKAGILDHCLEEVLATLGVVLRDYRKTRKRHFIKLTIAKNSNKK